ncbi:uncharacterized protein LOC119078451 [Bradysia coprophila]|uniref:uncharacterized protein LOC119078451 n=1 Tax=Bradysia coprophila TaxID=38358 RepID=UPI00187DBCDA|nr:uncharacterized protein LOC119078451 [Bradysia coprophila]
MKAMIVNLAILLIGVQFASCQLREGPQKLKFHQSASCGEPSKTPILDFWMGPCYDTPGCKIPDCCGMVTGTQSNFGIKYNATVPMTSGTFHGQLGGVGIGNTDRKQIGVGIPSVTIPGAIASYETDACDSTECPQEVGNTYTFDMDFKFPTSALTTAFVNCHYVVRIESDDADTPALCYGCYGRLINSNLFPRLRKLLKETIRNPVSILKNPLGVLTDPEGLLVLPGF